MGIVARSPVRLTMSRRTGGAQMRGDAVPPRVHRHWRAQPGRLAGRAAGGVHDLRGDRAALVAPRKQPMPRLGQTPAAAPDRRPLRRPHGVAVLAALALLHAQHPPAAVDLGQLQLGRIGGAQRRAAVQAGHRFEDADHLVGAQHHRPRARLARTGNALRQVRPSRRHPVEDTQRADGLVERRPGDAAADQMHLIGTHVFESQPVRRTAEPPAERRHRMDRRSLGCRRQSADRHVLDQPAPHREHLGHRGSCCPQGSASPPTILSDRKHLRPSRPRHDGAVAKLVGIEGGVVCGSFNRNESRVDGRDSRPRHDAHYHEAGCGSA